MADNLKKYANKDGAKMLLWLIVGFFIIYFFSKIMSFLKSIFGISEEDQKAIEEGKKEFAAYRDKLMKVKGIDWNLAKSTAARWESLLSNHMVDWGAVSASIVKLSGLNFLAAFVEFGIRSNTVFNNQVGDLIDWLRKADTPLSFSGGNIDLIKQYINKISPTVSSISGLQSHLKKAAQL